MQRCTLKELGLLRLLGTLGDGQWWSTQGVGDGHCCGERKEQAVPPTDDSAETAAAANRCPHSPKELGLEWRRAGRADRCGLARKEELHKVLLYCETASQKAQMLSCTFKSEERIC